MTDRHDLATRIWLAISHVAVLVVSRRHRHEWYVCWHMGDLWTACATCGERRMLPPDASSEMPLGYPIEPEFRK